MADIFAITSIAVSVVLGIMSVIISVLSLAVGILAVVVAIMIPTVFTAWQKPKITMNLDKIDVFDRGNSACDEMLFCELYSHVNSNWQIKLGAFRRTIEEFHFFYTVNDINGRQYASGNTSCIQRGRELRKEIRSFPVAYNEYILSIGEGGTKYELGRGIQLISQKYSITFLLRYAENMETHTSEFTVQNSKPYIIVTKK